MIVRSSDGVDVAVHELGGAADAPILLVSHATGFHAWCYQPMAQALADRFHTIGLDYRGHGDTAQPAGVPVDWERYADDVQAVAASLGTGVIAFGHSPSTGLVAFGHSMGGACLLIAAHRQPQLFSRLVVFEPIVFDPALAPEDSSGPPQLAISARRRRSTFPSFEAAIANFAAKPPLRSFTPAALDAYVRHGFRPGDDGQVHLKCAPELEATTFEMSRAQTTWDMLPEIETPVLVLSGRVHADSPALHARPVAERLRHGRYLELPEMDHFAPMTHPDVIAQLI